MSNILLPQVKLPYKYTRGSVSLRQQRADKLTDKLYHSLRGRFDKNGELKLDNIQKCIDEILPQRIKVLVKNAEPTDEFDAYSDILYSDKSGKIKVTTIELPSKKGKVKLIDLPTILHEFQHVADQIFHPKYLARNQSMSNASMYTKKYNVLYDEYMYSYEGPVGKKDRAYILKHLRHRIKHFLRKMKPEEKIDYLQDSRYNLMMENKAYFTQQKYAKKLQKQHVDVKTADITKWNKDYMFAEKIKLLEDIIASIIEKEREKFKIKARIKALRNIKSKE